ncbi:MSMEG_6728 family protein, partial [Frankia sp. EI5c]|uniref:MSMEG_6728 family protein n=1 Tax=Frankia sp. EI5c TaxID=683316 RepID=UPI001F5B066F
MQTFLPYPDFAATAAVLDERRLGKQRVEALQILRALTYAGYGWQHHPAVRMWAGHPRAVAAYGLVICAAWTAGGRADTCAATITADLARAGLAPPRSQQALADQGDLP